MEDWWVWSSNDLVYWKLESVIKPVDTYLKKPFNQCWATDAAFKNGKYYFYFSEGNQRTGVMVGNSPTGPWKDPLGKPLLNSDLTPTKEYDISVLVDDDNTPYLLFGAFDYYIVKLNDDMISLAESPRKIRINNSEGPYGKGKTDDKPCLHKRNGKYYLSWGCFYAMSDSIYGPYDFKGSVMNAASFTPGYEKPTWPNGPFQGRHGNFFEWNNQWYFSYCDISQTGNRYYRDSFISYVHFKENGEMSPVRVDGIGVGEYDANQPLIEAEDFFNASKIKVNENDNGGFFISEIGNNDFLTFPNIQNLGNKSSIVFNLKKNIPLTVEIHKDTPKGDMIASYKINGGNPDDKYEKVSCKLPKMNDKQSLSLVFKGKGKQLFQLDSFWFK